MLAPELKKPKSKKQTDESGRLIWRPCCARPLFRDACERAHHANSDLRAEVERAWITHKFLLADP